MNLNNLNQTFISNIYSIFGAAGDAWLASLPDLLKELSEKWEFKLDKPMVNLSYHFVGLVHMLKSNHHAVIKIAPVSEMITQEVAWLKLIRHGVPLIHAHDKHCHAYLMEALHPGISLKSRVQNGSDDEATSAICRVIRAIQSNQIDQSQLASFKHLSEFVSELSVLNSFYPKALLSKAISLFDELSQRHEDDVLLHGDLHHDNILSCGEEWKAIDPHGYVGDPVAEVGAMIRNPFDSFPNHDCLQSVIERRLHMMSDELAFDFQRVKAWAFCMTVLSDAWTIQDHPCASVDNLDIKVVEAIDKAK